MPEAVLPSWWAESTSLHSARSTDAAPPAAPPQEEPKPKPKRKSATQAIAAFFGLVSPGGKDKEVRHFH
jgi:hypothetical protein